MQREDKSWVVTDPWCTPDLNSTNNMVDWVETYLTAA